MLKNIYGRKYLMAGLIAAGIVFAATGCKKQEKLDISSSHSSAAETMASETKKESGEAEKASEPAKSGEEKGKENDKKAEPAIKTKAASYTEGRIKVSYPEIEGMDDAQAQKKINEIIAKNASAFISGHELDAEKTTADIEYKIISADRKRLAISYTGEYFTEGTAHPTRLFYTNTIDLEKRRSLGLSDFTDPYTMAGYVLSDDVVLADAASDTAKAFMEARKERDIEEYTKLFKEADFPYDKTFPESFSYQLGGDIYFSVPVSHAMGDYVMVKFSPAGK